MWPEVDLAMKEKKCELKLLGAEIGLKKNYRFKREKLTNFNPTAGKIAESGLDKDIFLIESLNLLTICDTKLDEIPPEIASLSNLQNLLLYRNCISKFPRIETLEKLKVLDLSFNTLTSVPDEINQLPNLSTINLSNNALEAFPALSKTSKLIVLNLGGNMLTRFPELNHEELPFLSDLDLKNNRITEIPDSIQNIQTLKVLNLEKNQIKVLPKALSSLPKLKDLFLKENPIADKRLLKLINQCGTKQIVDYVKQHGTAPANPPPVKAAGDGKKGGKTSKNSDSTTEQPPKILIRKYEDDKSIRIVCSEAVKLVRPHIICCVWRDIAFDAASYKKFIQLQTKLHDTVCEKRELCTIATHDLDKIATENCALSYHAEPAKSLVIIPLGRGVKVTGQKLFDELKSEAEALRKEKKRNVYSGIHKYLHLLEKDESYACLKDSKGVTISLPPLTNSDDSRISVQTKNILVEITSSSSLPGCKRAMEAFFTEVAQKGLGKAGDQLIVEQVRVVDSDGTMRNIFPSKVDLVSDLLQVERE